MVVSFSEVFRFIVSANRFVRLVGLEVIDSEVKILSLDKASFVFSRAEIKEIKCKSFKNIDKVLEERCCDFLL